MVSRPSRAYRIADRRHEIFDGTGAFLYGARWNSPGRRIIYAADSFAGAMLEMLVHTRIGRVPRTHAWIEIDIPAEVSVEVIEAADIPGWDAEDSPHARRFGDDWYDERRTAALVVPSVATHGLGQNVLFNQDHVDFPHLGASSPRDVVWDVRLFGEQ